MRHDLRSSDHRDIEFFKFYAELWNYLVGFLELHEDPDEMHFIQTVVTADWGPKDAE
jgi:hypothetical protein